MGTQWVFQVKENTKVRFIKIWIPNCVFSLDHITQERMYMFIWSHSSCAFLWYSLFCYFFPLVLKATREPKASLWFGRTQLHWTRIEKKINFKKKVSSGSSQTVWYFSFWIFIAWWRLLLWIFLMLFLSSWNYMNRLYEIWLCSNVPASQRRSLISVYCNHITFHIFILT